MCILEKEAVSWLALFELLQVQKQELILANLNPMVHLLCCRVESLEWNHFENPDA